MRVNFLHPRGDGSFPADVDSWTTGEKCLRGLIDHKFIEPAPRAQPYRMVVTRTQVQVLPTTTMEGAGVMSGDSLAILQQGNGA